MAFEILGVVAVMTNCGLLSMSTELRKLNPKMDPARWLLIWVVAEHVILAIKLFIAKAIPDVPEWVSMALSRTQYHAKQALSNQVKYVPEITLLLCSFYPFDSSIFNCNSFFFKLKIKVIIG